MKTSKAQIRGKEYLMCFSTRVVIECHKRYGGIENAMKKIFPGPDNDQEIEAVFWLFYEMLKAGSAYAKINGIDNPDIMTYDELIDSVGIDDYPQMLAKVIESTEKGIRRSVETVPGKNTETTRG